MILDKNVLLQKLNEKLMKENQDPPYFISGWNAAIEEVILLVKISE